MAEKLALVGIGKIARDQHIPAIAGNPDWQLEAAVFAIEDTAMALHGASGASGCGTSRG